MVGKKVALVGNDSPESQKTLSDLKELLLNDESQSFDLTGESPEIVVSVGGDGTMLKALHLYENQVQHLRFVGVHTGHLGFYTDYLAQDLKQLVNDLRDETCENVIRYPLLKVSIVTEDGQNEIHYALNESSIERYNRPLMLIADVKISGEFFEKFRGDGLSVSTPTGSTAYNLSLGGAVLPPQLEAMQMTEVASLNNIVFRTLGRPIIVTKTDSITICPSGETDDYTVTVDQLVFSYPNLKEVTYSLDGTTIAFCGCRHTPFWQRVRNSFIGDVR